MERRRVGNIEVIIGDKGGRFPFSNTLFVDDAVKVVIDPGAGFDRLHQLKNRTRVDLVINTHYHLDHIRYNYLFEKSAIYVNDMESGCYGSPREIARRYGFDRVYGQKWVDGWLERISRPDTPHSPYSLQNRYEWTRSTSRLDGVFRWGETMDFGATRMEVIGSPGHTYGCCCLYFPGCGAVYTGDIDLTRFGPWYAEDGDINLFVSSARRIASLPAETFITGHEAGVMGRREFITRLEAYLKVIEERDTRIMESLTRPSRLDQIASLGLIYGVKYHKDSWIKAFEEIMIRKHLDRLIDKGLVRLNQGLYEVI